MSSILIIIICIVVAAAAGAGATMLIQRSLARTRAKLIIEEAQRDADDLKKTKILEGREEALKITSEAEKVANQRLSKAQSVEAKLKQRELQLNQQQSENQRAKNEIDSQRTRLEEQNARNEARKAELDKLTARAQEELEHISGLSSEEAKEKLIQSLKDERSEEHTSELQSQR